MKNWLTRLFIDTVSQHWVSVSHDTNVIGFNDVILDDKWSRWNRKLGLLTLIVKNRLKWPGCSNKSQLDPRQDTIFVIIIPGFSIFIVWIFFILNYQNQTGETDASRSSSTWISNLSIWRQSSALMTSNEKHHIVTSSWSLKQNIDALQIFIHSNICSWFL